MPLITVVIPVYNGEKTIRETIQSVFNQSLSDLELLVINDGSTDSTLEVVSQIKDERLKVYTYPNAGLAASRNRGISLAKSEYISFIDADDLWTSDKLEAQFKALQKNPKAAVVYSWTDWIDEFSQSLGKGSHNTQNGEVLAQLLLNDFVANGSNCLIKMQAFREVGGFDETLTAVEDWDMWLRLAERYQFVAVPSPQVLYRVTSNSMSFNVWGMESASLRIIEKAFANAPQSLQYLKRDSIGNRYKYLTFKALDGIPERKKGLAATRFLWNAIAYDPSLLQAKVIWKVLFKITAMILLPPKLAEEVINQFQPLSNTITLLGYIKFNPV